MNKVLLIDNFDSFTFNLYQYLSEISETEVYRNDKIPFDKLENGDYSHIVISPGPGNPTDEQYFGSGMKVIKNYQTKIPILGICLGHQALGASFGGSVVKAGLIMHGKTSSFTHSGLGLFCGLPDEISVMRYHSLVVRDKNFPDELIVDSRADDGSIMGFHHKSLPVYGLQFHPESFRTETGKQMLKNFIAVKR